VPVAESPEPLDALAARARAGDEGAFAALAGAARERVRRWALVRTGDPDDAEDVAQEVAIRVHRGLARFEGRSAFTTWLYRLAVNAASELGRSRGRIARLNAAAELETAASPALADRIGEMENARAAALVRTLFAELPGRQREVFDLVDLQGHTPAEAAEMLEIEAATARVHLLRARRAIRERILAEHPNLLDDR
jgi:RNA polymerase sigma-70 factor (ECF subfamily)